MQVYFIIARFMVTAVSNSSLYVIVRTYTKVIYPICSNSSVNLSVFSMLITFETKLGFINVIVSSTEIIQGVICLLSLGK